MPAGSALIAGLVGLMVLVGLGWRKIAFGFVCLGALLGPLIPLTQFPGLVSPDRYLLLAWWVYDDIQRRKVGSRIWVVVALLTGLFGTFVYALVRVGDRPT